MSLLSSPSRVFGGEPNEERARLLVARLVFTVVGLALPVYGVILNAFDPSAVDPLWVRLVIGAVSLGLLASSFRHAWTRRHAGALWSALLYVVTGWYGVLMGLNGVSQTYAFALFHLVTVSGLAYILAFDRTRPLLAYLSSATAAMLAVFAVVPGGSVDRVLYVGTVVGVGAVIYLVALGRIKLYDALRVREAHLEAAQHVARLGSWSWDLRREEQFWSDEAYRLLGHPAKDAPPSVELFMRVVHPADRARVRRHVEAARHGEAEGTLDLRVVGPGDAVRTLRLRTGCVQDERGRTTRVTGIVRDVTEEVEHERTLVQARERAEAAARAKSAFLANMSHEIRTPLTSVIGFAELLRDVVEDDHRGLVEPIFNGGRRLLDTLDAVLDLARLEAGRLRLDPAPLDPAEEVADVLGRLRPHAEEKHVALAFEGPGVGATAVLDRAAFQRVVENLVGNAIKFTSEGHVAVSLGADAESLHLRVEDTGIGIEPRFMPYLFAEFEQASTGLARSHEGSGLGLAITDQLVRLMGGTIAVDSTPGAGSTFTVVLPRRTPADAAAAGPAVVAPGGDGAGEASR